MQPIFKLVLIGLALYTGHLIATRLPIVNDQNNLKSKFHDDAYGKKPLTEKQRKWVKHKARWYNPFNNDSVPAHHLDHQVSYQRPDKSFHIKGTNHHIGDALDKKRERDLVFGLPLLQLGTSHNKGEPVNQKKSDRHPTPLDILEESRHRNFFPTVTKNQH